MTRIFFKPKSKSNSKSEVKPCPTEQRDLHPSGLLGFACGIFFCTLGLQANPNSQGKNSSKASSKAPRETSNASRITSLFPPLITFQQRQGIEAENLNMALVLGKEKNADSWQSLRRPNPQVLDWMRSQKEIEKQFGSEYGRSCMVESLQSLQDLEGITSSELAKKLNTSSKIEKIEISEIHFHFVFSQIQRELESASGDCKAKLLIKVDSKSFPNGSKSFEHWHRIFNNSNPLKKVSDDLDARNLEQVIEKQVNVWNLEFKQNQEILEALQLTAGTQAYPSPNQNQSPGSNPPPRGSSGKR